MAKQKEVLWMQATLAVAVAFIAITGFQFARAVKRLPGPGQDDARPTVRPKLPPSLPVAEEAWQVFQGSGGSAAKASDDDPMSRFRLAGTFSTFGDVQSGGEIRKAILDDLQLKSQLLAGEGDPIADFTVAQVLEDRVTLRRGDRDYVLHLLFESKGAPAGKTNAVAEAGSESEEVALEVNKFGKRIAENRWVLDRQTLLEYYNEVMDDPERVAALFVSLKPDYDPASQIKGYYLESEGEQEFFRSVGLAEGDVIRKVNAMNMTSQKRAEFLIGEFVKNRMNAIVMDIERDGQPEKLIYLVR